MDKKFEKLRFDRTENKDVILSALSDVYDFIVQKKLILVGGMSLDFAFKLKGGQLYGEDTLPDYDFLSFDHYNDAIELGVQMQKKFPDYHVDAIVAKHITTMRVRLNNVVVADISYCPKNIFDKLPTINYKNLLIIHPYYTLMDQFDAFANPYKGAPTETISQRWGKDLKRMAEILRLYPMNEQLEKELKESDAKELKVKPKKTSTTKQKVKGGKENSSVKKYLIGWHALSELKLIKPSQVVGPAMYICDGSISTKKSFHKTMSIPSYNEDIDGTRYYDCTGVAIIVNSDNENKKNTKNTASLQTIAWFFASDWVFNASTKSLEGLYIVIKALETPTYPIKASPPLTFPHIDEINELQKEMLLHPEINNNNAIKPMNISFTKYNGTKPKWDYSTSPYFAIDGAFSTKKA